MKRSVFLALVCLAYAAIASLRLTAPFTSYLEGLCGQYATLARATTVHGFTETRLGLLEVAGTDLSIYDNWRDDYYPNRPPVSVLGPAVFFHIFGAHEWVFRLNLILVGMGTILVFAGVVRRLLASPWDRVATACFAFMPLFNYFSHVVTHLDYVLFFSLLAWYANLRWDEGRRFRVLLFAALFLACQSDWAGYFAAVSIAGHRFRGWKSGLSYGILAACGGFFAIQVLHLLWIRPDGHLLKQFLLAGAHRSWFAGFGPLDLFLREGAELLRFGTAAGMVLAGLGIAAALRRGANRTFLWLALLDLEEVAFTFMSYHHDFLTFAGSAFLALAAASGAAFLWERGRAARIAVAVLLVLGAAQSAWVIHSLQTWPAYEIYWKMGVAVRQHTRPDERILLTIRDHKRYTDFYTERHMTSRELGDPRLSVRYQGPGEVLKTDEDLLRYVEREGGRYDVIVAGDAKTAFADFDFWRNSDCSPDSLDRWGYYPPDHPLRQLLERDYPVKEVSGPFLFYRRKKE